MSDCLERSLKAALLVAALALSAPITLAQTSEEPTAAVESETTADAYQSAVAEVEAAAERNRTLTQEMGEQTSEPVEGPQAQRARSVIDQLLEYLSPPQGEMGGFELDRDYTLVEEDDAFVARFPSASWVQDTARADFGPLVLTVNPLETDQSRLTVRLGQVITLSDGAETLARIAIGEQNLTGIWDPELRTLAQGESHLENVVAIAPENRVALRLERFDGNQILDRDPDESWRQRQTLELAGLTLEGGEHFALERLRGGFTLSGQNYAQMLEQSRQLQQAIEEMDPEDPQAMEQLTEYLGGIYQAFSRFEGDLTLENLEVGDPQAGGTQVALVSMETSFGEEEMVADPDSQSEATGGNWRYAFTLDGIQADPDFAPPGLLPHSARLELGLTDIPHDLLGRVMEIGMESEQIADDEMRQAFIGQRFLELLMSSDLGFFIQDSFVKAPEAQLNLRADIEVNPDAAFGAAGTLKLTVMGLDRIIQATGAGGDESASQMATMLLMFSDRRQEEEQIIDTFDLRLTPEGMIYLNGKDLSPMLMGEGAPGMPGMMEEPAQ
ncbi:MAG: hypothetical protein R3310_09425 [Candidatus Competibacteraceae bacterium]|nr:hypothetical protein [Candidatus Competibacteraceae bacterium]